MHAFVLIDFCHLFSFRPIWLQMFSVLKEPPRYFLKGILWHCNFIKLSVLSFEWLSLACLTSSSSWVWKSRLVLSVCRNFPYYYSAAHCTLSSESRFLGISGTIGSNSSFLPLCDRFWLGIVLVRRMYWVFGPLLVFLSVSLCGAYEILERRLQYASWLVVCYLPLSYLTVV